MRTAKTDQTGRMPRLIRVFARRTLILLVCHEVAHLISGGAPLDINIAPNCQWKFTSCTSVSIF